MSYWDLLSDDLQGMIMEIVKRNKFASKIQNIIRKKRPVRKYTTEFKIGDEVIIHYRDNKGNRRGAFGIVSKSNEPVWLSPGRLLHTYKYTCKIMTTVPRAEHTPPAVSPYIGNLPGSMMFTHVYYYDQTKYLNFEPAWRACSRLSKRILRVSVIRRDSKYFTGLRGEAADLRSPVDSTRRMWSGENNGIVFSNTNPF
jgi:hypothetical protein